MVSTLGEWRTHLEVDVSGLWGCVGLGFAASLEAGGQRQTLHFVCLCVRVLWLRWPIGTCYDACYTARVQLRHGAVRVQQQPGCAGGP
jgi:hypothetical protein